jgi:signal transduction histidine kinase
VGREYEYDRLKNEFITNISHELRTPLNVILATVQLAESYMKREPEEYVEKSARNMNTIKQNSLRLLRLVNNLIDINKIEAGFMKLHMQQIDIVGLTQSISQSVAQYAGAKDVCLRFESDNDEKIIYCDYDTIERILLNLLSNAIKFTNPGGDVLVKITDKGDKVLISVNDSGIGIAVEKQKIIFQRFRQADQSLARSHEGSGIGLSLVKSLVELLDGEISVTSEEGKGTQFTVELPVKGTPDKESLVETSYKEKAIRTDVLKRVNIELSDISF